MQVKIYQEKVVMLESMFLKELHLVCMEADKFMLKVEMLEMEKLLEIVVWLLAEEELELELVAMVEMAELVDMECQMILLEYVKMEKTEKIVELLMYIVN